MAVLATFLAVVGTGRRRPQPQRRRHDDRFEGVGEGIKGLERLLRRLERARRGSVSRFRGKGALERLVRRERSPDAPENRRQLSQARMLAIALVVAAAAFAAATTAAAAAAAASVAAR